MEPLKKRLNDGARVLKEAADLVQEGTLDALLRYYQTGNIHGLHLPSAVAPYDHTVAMMLADRLRPILHHSGVEIKQDDVEEKGVFTLFYQKGPYRCYFATVNPYERTISYHFDFDEMEREREIKLSRLKTKQNELFARHKTSQTFIDETRGNLIRRFKDKTMVARMRKALEAIPGEITAIEQELKEINRNKKVIEELKRQLPDLQLELRRYGFLFESRKGEDYEI